MDVDHGAAFPPSRVVVEPSDFVEAELLVVVGAHPLGGVDDALLQRRMDIGANDLFRHHSHAGDYGGSKTPDAHPDALEVIHCDQLLAEPAAHLSPRVAD